ncbi:MAG: hypothetical protein IPF77_04425 [Gemmatimonadetes bacterium]|nr:hypothetical protein [Gemmatimonadota bacterium]
MRWLLLPLKLLGLLLLAALLSGGWLFRDQILRQLRPQVSRVTGALTGADAGVPDAAGLARARDKVDSLHGWHADSVLLSASEMASLVREGLPPEVRDRMDSLRLDLGEGRLTVSARLETSRIPADALGPLAGALEPWEPVSATGVVEVTRPGQARWRVDGLTLRGFTLPEQASRDLVGRALPGAPDGAIPFDLPTGVARLRIRPTGVALYPKETR